MGHLPRKYTDVGKKELRIAEEALQTRLAVKELQEQMKALEQQKAQPTSALAPAPAPEAKASPASVQLSRQAAEANAYTNPYEKVILPRQGDDIINGDQSVAQDFKNKYEVNLANELKEKLPGALEAKAEDIKQNDAYSLSLGAGLSLV